MSVMEVSVFSRITGRLGLPSDAIRSARALARRSASSCCCCFALFFCRKQWRRSEQIVILLAQHRYQVGARLERRSASSCRRFFALIFCDSISGDNSARRGHISRAIGTPLRLPLLPLLRALSPCSTSAEKLRIQHQRPCMLQQKKRVPAGLALQFLKLQCGPRLLCAPLLFSPPAAALRRAAASIHSTSW